MATVKPNIRALSTREKKILVVFLLAASVFLGYRFIFIPMKEQIEKLGNQIKLQEKKLSKSLRILEKEKAIEEEYDRYAVDFKQKASDEQQMALILSQVESAATQLNLRIADLKPGRVKKGDFYNNFLLNLVLEGDLPAINQFLYTVQNRPYFFQIEEVYFEKSSVRTSQIKCRLLINKAFLL